MPGTLFVVATPIGNLDDISARALKILRVVALIAAEDTRRTARLLARYAISTPTTSLHEHNEVSKTPTLIARLERGDDIALVSDAGSPGVSDPGQRVVQAAIGAGIRVEPVPGPSAVMAVLMASGLPADSFLFLGFPPTRSSDRKTWMNDLRSAGRTVVFFEAPHRIVSTLGEIQSLIGDQEIVVAREMTKTHETTVKGPISEVLGSIVPRGEFAVAIDVGHMIEVRPADGPPTDAALHEEFGRMIDDAGLTRRAAIASLARRHGLSTNEVYRALERSRKLAT